MATVHNKHHRTAPSDAVYIGRPSIWGNPYSHRSDTLAKFQVKTTNQALVEYSNYMLENPLLIARARRELKGKDLVCFCKPGPCHGDILERIANTEGDEWW